MATEVLRPHNILQPQTQRIRAAHRRPSNPGTTRRSPPPPATAVSTTGRRHHGRPSSSSSSYGKVTSAAAPARRPAVEVYAGPAFSAASPEPSSLPLPQFPLQKPAAAVNDAATRDLRRMLRLE
ncbi:hypothetical protein CFC21_072167 [Triticum aestivum]|uniref:Uncharacterized protein n=2 Tax=Triticum aestivum TaxID=4565 RepID=A0A3B6LNX6_WHEAT|nr:uncharacterized protein LOC119310804 [Triticum dicoccoides]XP_044389288.1 uncharacterized protein LOC123112383 [Triticum aestivum]KAF7066134.1 hypothetical protein CFC21_072167 [Triticum aestivum]